MQLYKVFVSIIVQLGLENCCSYLPSPQEIYRIPYKWMMNGVALLDDVNWILLKAKSGSKCQVM